MSELKKYQITVDVKGCEGYQVFACKADMVIKETDPVEEAAKAVYEKYLSKVTGLSFGQSSNSCQSALKELATDINYKDCTGVHHANRDDHE